MDQTLNYIIDNPLLILIGLIFILFVWVLILNVRLGALRKRISRMTRGDKFSNVEQIIISYQEEMSKVRENIENNSKKVNYLLEKVSDIKGNVGVVRYNAFGEEGNDLSYSIAIIDDSKSGVVITSIYNRGESNTYAKPIEKGESKYKLSQEEINAIQEAIKG